MIPISMCQCHCFVSRSTFCQDTFQDIDYKS